MLRTPPEKIPGVLHQHPSAPPLPRGLTPTLFRHLFPTSKFLGHFSRHRVYRGIHRPPYITNLSDKQAKLRLRLRHIFSGHQKLKLWGIGVPCTYITDTLCMVKSRKKKYKQGYCTGVHI